MGTYNSLTNSAVVMIVMAFITVAATNTDACSYGKTPPEAVIGERMVLTCLLSQNETCFSGLYDWYQLDHSDNSSLSEHNDTLLVSENVTSAEEVGGQMFKCRCSGTEYCRLFKIGVKPRVYLHASSEVARSGSSVNITCMAESYPPADSINNYQMKHPKNTPINRTPLPGMNGVVHIITSANKTHDAGDYECTVYVTMEEYSTPLQSDNAVTNLIVYNAPMIVKISDFTINDMKQTAILQCFISNTEDELEVWVHWTTSDGKRITKEHVMLQKANVFYLLVDNATAEEYMCQVFSTYSPDIPEDEEVVSVVMSVPAVTSPRDTEGLTKEYNCSTAGYIAVIAILLVLVIMTTITSILGLIYYKWKHGSCTTQPAQKDDSESKPNSSETHIDREVPQSEDGSSRANSKATTPEPPSSHPPTPLLHKKLELKQLIEE